MRLAELQQRMGDTISVEWRSFLLRPEPKTPDQRRFVAYTRSWMRPADLEPRAPFRIWATDQAQPTSSVPPHVAAKAVARIAPDRVRDFRDALFLAYFAANHTISDPAVLAQVAEAVGVDPDGLAETMQRDGDELTRQVHEEHNEALARGITAVPTVVIDDNFAIPGAQEAEAYEAWIRRILERRSPTQG